MCQYIYLYQGKTIHLFVLINCSNRSPSLSLSRWGVSWGWKVKANAAFGFQTRKRYLECVPSGNLMNREPIRYEDLKVITILTINVFSSFCACGGYFLVQCPKKFQERFNLSLWKPCFNLCSWFPHALPKKDISEVLDYIHPSIGTA